MPETETLADSGLIERMYFLFTCSITFGASEKLFGTIHFFVKNEHPVVFDMATSSLALGDVQIAAEMTRASCWDRYR